MKNYLIVTMLAATLLFAGVPVLAQPTQLQPAQPAQLQPRQAAAQPVISTPAPEAQRATLGDAGLMYAEEAEAKAAAAVMPAAGGATPAAVTAPVAAKPAKTVGGVVMLPSKTIIENVSSSKDFTTLVKALQTAGLTDTLSAPGPFTVFAPTDRAFAKLPKKSLADLMAPAGRDKLAKLLNYHVVAGTHDAAAIMADIKAGNGAATYSTLAGSELKARIVKGVVTLTDENGNVSHVTTPDVFQANGVVHVVDTVVIPK